MKISRTIQTLKQWMWTYNTCKVMSGHGERSLEHTYIFKNLKIGSVRTCHVICPASKIIVLYVGAK